MKKLKQAVQSRTVLFGTLVTGISLFEQFAPFIPPQYAAGAGAVVGIGTILLRFLTSTPVFKDERPAE